MTSSHFHYHSLFFHDKSIFFQRCINVASRQKHRAIFVLSISFFLLLFFNRFFSIDDNLDRHRHFQQLDSLQDIDIFHNNNQAIVRSRVNDVNRHHSLVETSQSKTKEEILLVVIVVIVVVILAQIVQNKTRHRILVFRVWCFCRFFRDDFVNNAINVDNNVAKVFIDRIIFKIKIASDTNKLANVNKAAFQYLTRQFHERHKRVSISFLFILT